MAVLSFITAASVVAASAIVMEAISAPAVAIAPAGPGANTQEDTTVKVSRPVIPIRGATVWRSFVIAPAADGWNADFYDGRLNNNTGRCDADDNLCASCRHKSQTRKQCCSSE
jgi:hypothetical protein